MNKKTIIGLTGLAALIGVATAAGVVASKKKKQLKLASDENKSLPQKRNIYFAGGGLAALSCAYYLIHDCKIPGDSIHIFEESENIGGAFNFGGDSETGYVLTIPKLLSVKNHPNLMNMLNNISSVNIPDMSVKDEIINFMGSNPVYENARIIDDDGYGEGFDFNVSKAAIKNIKSLIFEKDYEISHISIDDYFANTRDFFKSNLWELISTSYMLKPSSSVSELKHILICLNGETDELFTLKNSVRSQLNLQETIINALEKYLVAHNVSFATHCRVVSADFTEDSYIINAIHLDDNGTSKTFYLNKNDLFFVTNGSASECATIGDYNSPAPEPDTEPASAMLWKELAQQRIGMGNPDTFYNAENSEIISFTITAKSSVLYDAIRSYTNNTETTGVLTTFKSSPWKLSVCTVAQPYFSSQTDETWIICCYGINTDKVGRYVDKTMKCSSGAELLFELVKHMGLEDIWDDITKDIINVIPCKMPYAAASSLPYYDSEKPLVIPNSDGNLAFIGQFAKLGNGISYSSEYSVRTGREAAYRLTNTKKYSTPPPRAVMASYVKLLRSLKA